MTPKAVTPELLADLAEAGALAEVGEVGDGVALAFGHVLVGRRRSLQSPQMLGIAGGAGGAAGGAGGAAGAALARSRPIGG